MVVVCEVFPYFHSYLNNHPSCFSTLCCTFLMAFYKESYRLAGISYLNYSNICARAVRNSLKEPLRSDHILKADLWRYSWITYNERNEQKIGLFSLI